MRSITAAAAVASPNTSVQRENGRFLAHAPGEYYESMLKNVRLNREIMEAWEEHGGKIEGEGDE